MAIHGAYADRVASVGGANALTGIAVGYGLILGIWSALVASLLSDKGNKWGGISGGRLALIVLGLTLALDLASSPCFIGCPPTGLIVPILSYVFLYNTSMPPPPEDQPPQAVG